MGFGTMNNYMQYWFVWAAHHSQISSSRANERIIDLVSAHQKPGLPPTACQQRDVCSILLNLSWHLQRRHRTLCASLNANIWSCETLRLGCEKALVGVDRWGALLRCHSVSVSACEFETRQIPIKKVWTLPMIWHKAETLSWMTMQHHNADKGTSMLSCLRVAFNNIMPMHMCKQRGTPNHHSIASCLFFL